MKARERQALIARRAELLELEAQVQRVALAATFAQLEQKKALGYAASLGSVALSLLRVPRIRWLLMATLLAKIRKKKERD